jgi:hypothetical protein
MTAPASAAARWPFRSQTWFALANFTVESGRLFELSRRMGAWPALFAMLPRRKQAVSQLSPADPQHYVDNVLISLMLAGRNGRKCSNGAVSSRGLLATMEAQQAVAIRFVGRRVTVSTCLFFAFRRAALPRLTSLCEVSVRRNDCIVVSPAQAL